MNKAVFAFEKLGNLRKKLLEIISDDPDQSKIIKSVTENLSLIKNKEDLVLFTNSFLKPFWRLTETSLEKKLFGDDEYFLDVRAMEASQDEQKQFIIKELLKKKAITEDDIEEMNNLKLSEEYKEILYQYFAMFCDLLIN